MRLEVMLDLETMGSKSPNSAIVAIGAVKMNMGLLRASYIDSPQPPSVPAGFITDHFYVAVDLADCQRHGLVVEGDTVMWWLKQSEEARKALYAPSDGDGKLCSLEAALRRYLLWATTPEGETYPHWGNGSDFDCVLLRNAYNALNIVAPWRYHQNRCYRTLKNLVPKSKQEALLPSRDGYTAHNALDDAAWQAEHLYRIAYHLKLEF